MPLQGVPERVSCPGVMGEDQFRLLHLFDVYSHNFSELDVVTDRHFY